MISKFPEAGANVLWRQEIGAGYAGPSVVGNQLFVMDRTVKEEPAEGKDGLQVEKTVFAKPVSFLAANGSDA
jgi:hypothetical protein